VSARNVDAGFVELARLLEEEKRVATEFLRLTGTLAGMVTDERVELIEDVLNERQAKIRRADELKIEVDVLYLALRGQLSPQGLALFNSGKDEIACIWRNARDQDKLVASAMEAMLADLREKVREAQQGKKGYKAYAESEMMAFSKDRTE